MVNWRRASAILFFSLLLAYGAVFFQLQHQLLRGYSDFVSFYTAGKILQRGDAQRLYDLALQYDIQREVAPDVEIRQAALPFVRPAFEAWLFWPLAYLPYSVAFIIWNSLSCGCLLAVVLILRQEIPELRRVSIGLSLLAVFSFFPVFVTILQGQDSILLLLIYVVTYKLLARHEWFLSGIILGLGIIKFTLVLPFLVFFLVRKKLSVILGFAATSLVLLGISAATVGAARVAEYPKFLMTIERITRGVNVPRDMPNLRGLLAVLGQTRLAPALNIALLGIASVLLLVFAVRRWKPGSQEDGVNLRLGFSLNLVVTILVSYHCHSFDLCLLILPLGLVLSVLPSRREAMGTRRLLMWSLGAAGFSPLYILLVFVFKVPALISVVLLIFVLTIGMEISERLAQARPAAESAASR